MRSHEGNTFFYFVVLCLSQEHIELQLQTIPILPVVEEQQMESSSLSLPDRVGPVPMEANVTMEPRRDGGVEEESEEQGIPPAATAAAAAVDGQARECSQSTNKVMCVCMLCTCIYQYMHWIVKVVHVFVLS